MKFRNFSFLTVVIGVLLLAVGIQAQEDDIAVTITAPAYMAYFLDNDQLLDEFEAENPGVRVEYVESSDDFFQRGITPPTEDPEEHLNGLENYVSKADVVFVDPFILTPEATTAGYFLNMGPLTDLDDNLDIGDYYTAAWEAYQWDGGLWAIPGSMNVQFLVYIPAAFDEYGLQYPSADWTIDDFANAVRTMTEFNAEGQISRPAFLGGSESMLRGFYGQGFYDSATVPNPPLLDTPELASLYDTLAELQQEYMDFSNMAQGMRFDLVPMRMDGIYVLDANYRGFGPGGEEEEPVEYATALLPGGTAQTNVSGFGVSAGTQHPEIAYELTKFITDRMSGQFGGEPARRSVVEDPDRQGFRPEISPENEAFLETVYQEALPQSELRYSMYLNKAAQLINEEELDPASALAEAQLLAEDAYQMALDRAETTVIEVEDAPAEVVLAEGETELNFGVSLFGPQLPNRQAWDQVIADFVASEPSIGSVDLDTNFYQEGAVIDCFFENFNRVQDTDLTTILNLDPFIDADPNFNPDDFIGNALEQVQREGRTWAYPISISPTIMEYDTELFNLAGVPEPTDGWTAQEFGDALRELDFVAEEDRPILFLGGSNLELMMLIAAYGGLPVDPRTDPPTFNFTDPATVQAIQSVLDLARDEYIQYTPVSQQAQQDGGFGGGGGGGLSFNGRPVVSFTGINPFMFMQQQPPGQEGESPYRYTTLPSGQQYTPVSYNVGAAYINAEAQDPEACYRFISTLSQRPELFLAMPPRFSLLNSPELEASVDAETIELYRTAAERIGQPNAISFTFQGGSGPADFIAGEWLNRVFDRYVQSEEPIDLEAQLAEAEQITQTFRECAADLPEFTPPTPETSREETEAYYEDYFEQIDLCGMQADPDYISPFQR